MSKNPKKNIGIKRHQKAIKRKNKLKPVTKKKSIPSFRLESNIIKKGIEDARRRSNTNQTVEAKYTTREEILKEGEKNLKETRKLFNYLAFVDFLIGMDKLPEFKFKHDIHEIAKEYIALTRRFQTFGLIEDDVDLQMEMVDFGEAFLAHTIKMTEENTRLEPYSKYIDGMIMKCIPMVQEENDKRTVQELAFEVLRISGIKLIQSQNKLEEKEVENV